MRATNRLSILVALTVATTGCAHHGQLPSDGASVVPGTITNERRIAKLAGRFRPTLANSSSIGANRPRFYGTATLRRQASLDRGDAAGADHADTGRVGQIGRFFLYHPYSLPPIRRARA